MGLLEKRLCSFDNMCVITDETKSLKIYKMYPLITSISYISEVICTSYTPDW